MAEEITAGQYDQDNVEFFTVRDRFCNNDVT